MSDSILYCLHTIIVLQKHAQTKANERLCTFALYVGIVVSTFDQLLY